MMSTGEGRPPAFNGQGGQQRHPENESNNHGFLPVSSSGAFLLPADPQGAFAFSAEPSMIDYTSMVSLTPSSGAQDSVFSPNTGSSLDSSLHPEYMSHSYPPPNYMQTHQTYNLSPGTHSRTGQSVSPSHSAEHLSPEAGYLSDPNYQDLSSYTTPNFNGQYLEEPFSNLNFADQNITPNAFDTFPTGIEMTLPITPDVLATYNAQAHQMLPANIQTHPRTQMMSPCPTTDSSPIFNNEVPKNSNFTGVQYTRQEHVASSTPPASVPHTVYSTPNKQQQYSPALTTSSGSAALANPQPRAAHLTSPIVRIEHYSRDGSPPLSDASRPVSKRSHGSRRSGNHLSPFPAAESSDDDDFQHEQVRAQTSLRSTERADDGSWLPTGSGQAGLSPDDRQAMGETWVPTIEEIAEKRLKDEKKLEVEEWLTKSEAVSEAGDVGPSTNLLKPFAPRRRAKSTNDVNRQGYGASLGLGVRTDFDRPDDSGIPGPGVYIDERSEYDDDEDEEDGDGDPESPPAAIDIHASHADNSYFPPTPSNEPGSLLGAIVRPWVDIPHQNSASSTRYQPQTSNAAMMRFRLRAKDMETASLAATLGSRRLSESDIGSIRAAPGVIKAIEPDLKKQKERQRRPSFLGNILPKRTQSNVLKRKGSIPAQQQQTEVGIDKAKEPVALEKPKRIGSWGRPKSPRLDTNLANQGKEIGPPSATNLSATNGPWYHGAKNVIKRSRSRSDLTRVKSLGLAELMTQHGGPPMPMLASPLAETEATKASPPSPGAEDDDDEAAEAVIMDLTVRADAIIPNMEGFKTHARQLNPRLEDYMVDRITQEQMRRYKRLLEFRVKHLNAVKNRNCASGKFCRDLGGSSKQLPPRAGNKDSDAPFIGFQITAPGSSEDDGEQPPEGAVVPAAFPSGVPLPPVKRLPAEFECPLCFKVKKFYKPSDWTKHVHEDVQPFTCTFPNCGEPKSFKRKADWVRHENERHRQLENWTCQMPDCSHTCYRKDNFVQHLVREHKIAEPRARTGRTANKDGPGPDTEDIWSLVERCRRDTTKQPRDEPCRFCGNICNSWKKLTVHLAKHMEQISMPILPLVEQKHMNADTIISPVVELPESRKLSATPSKSPIDNPSRYIPNSNSTLAPGIDPSFGHYPHPHVTTSSAVASSVMHTYPPPQMVNYKNPQPAQKGSYMPYGTENVQTFTGQTYPGLQEPPKARSPYMNGQQQPYLNGNLQNGANGYQMTPISTVGQQQPAVFTSSPVDTTPYSTDALGPSYFTQEPQVMTTANNAMPDLGYNTSTTMPYNPPVYQGMPYMNAPQHNYPYQGQ